MEERGSSMSQWDNACHWQYHSRNASSLCETRNRREKREIELIARREERQRIDRDKQRFLLHSRDLLTRIVLERIPRLDKDILYIHLNIYNSIKMRVYVVSQFFMIFLLITKSQIATFLRGKLYKLNVSRQTDSKFISYDTCLAISKYDTYIINILPILQFKVN